VTATATQAALELEPDTTVLREKLQRGESPTTQEVEALVSQRLAARAVYGRPRAAIAALRALAVLDKVDPAPAARMIGLCLMGRPAIAAAALKALAVVRQARKR
jgi:hypothetical protein